MRSTARNARARRRPRSPWTDHPSRIRPLPHPDRTPGSGFPAHTGRHARYPSERSPMPRTRRCADRPLCRRLHRFARMLVQTSHRNRPQRRSRADPALRLSGSGARRISTSRGPSRSRDEYPRCSPTVSARNRDVRSPTSAAARLRKLQAQPARATASRASSADQGYPHAPSPSDPTRRVASPDSRSPAPAILSAHEARLDFGASSELQSGSRRRLGMSPVFPRARPARRNSPSRAE